MNLITCNGIITNITVILMLVTPSEDCISMT